jgi:hypothetical protein
MLLECRWSFEEPGVFKTYVLLFQLRGVIRTLNPKEEKYMQAEIKFKRQVFLRNVMRLKAIIVWFIDLSKYLS